VAVDCSRTDYVSDSDPPTRAVRVTVIRSRPKVLVKETKIRAAGWFLTALKIRNELLTHGVGSIFTFITAPLCSVLTSHETLPLSCFDTYNLSPFTRSAYDILNIS
jgi:hypothetical protein